MIGAGARGGHARAGVVASFSIRVERAAVSSARAWSLKSAAVTHSLGACSRIRVLLGDRVRIRFDIEPLDVGFAPRSERLVKLNAWRNAMTAGYLASGPMCAARC